MAIFLSAAHLILTFPDKDDANLIDHRFSKVATAMFPFQIPASKRDLWVPVIEKLVFTLGDQQLLTGLAMLIAAFGTYCTISVYHFTLVNDLAWFSATVHLITLRVLKDYLIQNHVQRDWRVALMVTMALQLAASVVMKGHCLWYDGWPYDAHCLFAELRGNIHGFSKRWMIVYLALICLIYSLNIIPLYHRPKAFMHHWLETKLRAFMDRSVECLIDELGTSPRSINWVKYLAWKLLIPILRILIWIHVAFSTSNGSRISHFLQDIVWFAYSLRVIMVDRQIPSDMVGEENTMTFGQIMPILLLISLALVFRETYDGT